MSRYILSYRGRTDPTIQEERALLLALEPATLLEQMPGSFLVDGTESELARVLSRFKKWRLSQEVTVRAALPK